MRNAVPTRMFPLLLLLVALSACAPGQPDGVEVSAAWSRASTPGATVGVVYFEIVNRDSQPDRLLSVSSPAAAQVELHESTMSADGMMRMLPLERLELPPGQALRFAPEGRHLMLVGLAAPLVEGAQIELTFSFERAPPRTVRLPVLSLFATAAPP